MCERKCVSLGEPQSSESSSRASRVNYDRCAACANDRCSDIREREREVLWEGHSWMDTLCHWAHTYTDGLLWIASGRRREHSSQWIAKVWTRRMMPSSSGAEMLLSAPMTPSLTPNRSPSPLRQENTMKVKSTSRPMVNGYHDKFKWSRREKPEAAVVSGKGSRVIFHPKWSNGTAGLRGNKPVNRLRTKCYWEVGGHFSLYKHF